MAADWHVKPRGHVWIDVTAGIAIGSRRGLRRVKHIDTVLLWVQEVVGSGRLTIGKTDTKEMLVDMLIEPNMRSTMSILRQRVGYQFCQGRHEVCLKV